MSTSSSTTLRTTNGMKSIPPAMAADDQQRSPARDGGADRRDHEHHELVERVPVDPLARVEGGSEAEPAGWLLSMAGSYGAPRLRRGRMPRSLYHLGWPIAVAVSCRAAPPHIAEPRDRVRDGRARPPCGVGTRLLGGRASLCYLCGSRFFRAPSLSADEPLKEPLVLARVDASKSAPQFLAPGEPPRSPQPDRHPAPLVRVAGRHREGGPEGDHRRRLADRGLHRQPCRRLRGDHLRRPRRDHRRVSREGPHLRAPADRQGRVPEPRDR